MTTDKYFLTMEEQSKMSVRDQLDFFMKSARKQVWIETEEIKAYVRKSHRMIEGRRASCFDVANVEVNLVHQGKGVFKAFMKNVEDIADLVYVENVGNKALKKGLEKHGYKRANAKNFGPDICLYKVIFKPKVSKDSELVKQVKQLERNEKIVSFLFADCCTPQGILTEKGMELFSLSVKAGIPRSVLIDLFKAHNDLSEGELNLCSQ